MRDETLPRCEREQILSRRLTIRELIRLALPRESELFPDLISNYEEYHAHTETGHLVRAGLIRDWIEPGASVLDAGCGDGLMAEYIVQELGARVQGIDVSNAAVEKTRTRGIPARVQDLDLDPQFPEGFDFILLVEVLEHLRLPHRVLAEAARTARKAVIVTIPNSAWIGYRVQVFAGHAPVQSFTHLHLWSHTDFLAFVDRLGLPCPESRFLSSRRSLRGFLVNTFPNLLAHQLAYRIKAGPDEDPS